MKRLGDYLTCITDTCHHVGCVSDQKDKQHAYFYYIFKFVFLIYDIHDTCL